MPEDLHFAIGTKLRLAFPENAGEAEIGATVVGFRAGELRLAFDVPTIGEQETLTRAIYSRADAWISSLESKEKDQPLKSLGRVIVLSFYGFKQVFMSLLPERASVPKPNSATLGAPEVAPSR